MTIQEAINEFELFKSFSDSVKRYSEWQLAISIGITAWLLTFDKFYYYLHIPVLGVSFLLIAACGFIKYKFHLREMMMNIYLSQLRQNQIKRELNESENDERYSKEFKRLMVKYREEDNKIIEVAGYTNYSTYGILIMLILAAITIVTNLLVSK